MQLPGFAGSLGTGVFDHLADAHAARDHGVDVGLRVDAEVEDGAPLPLLGPPDGFFYIITLLDGPGREAVRRGKLRVLGAGDRGL